MVLLKSPQDVQLEIAHKMREQRVQLGFTQLELAQRAGVKLPTLRKFEQKGQLSLEAFIKIATVLDMSESLLAALTVKVDQFATLDDLLKATKKPRQRGRRA